MNKIISSKSAKFAAGLVGVVAGFAMIATSVSAATFTTNLKVGSKGADVKNLQVILNMSADTQVAATGAGSPGNETSTFGPATKAAVIKFQNKYASDTLTPAGLTAGTGFVGALTRAKLNTMGGSTTTTSTVAGCTSNVGFSPTTGASCAGSTTTTTTTTTTSGPLSVTLANDNPAAAAVVAGQATADLAHFTFTGNGTIKNVKLLRTGISSNSTLSSVYLYQGSVRVSDGASVNNTDSSITFNNLSIAVNGSATLSVKADIAANTSGQIIGVTLIGYTATGATSMTTVSIAGNFMNVASAALAGVTASSTSSATASVNAGTMGQTFWSGAVNVSTRAVSLKGAAFKFIGSATSDAAANLKLYVNGSPVGSAATVDSVTNRLSFDFGTTPVTLNTGSQTVELRGDIMKGSNRSIQFNLENASDLIVMDSQLGVNVAVTAPTTLTFAAQNGTTVNVSTGSITTTVDPSFTSVTTVTGGATGATLGKFKLQAYGEDVKVSTLGVTVTLAGTTPGANGMNNVALFYNGSQIGSSQNLASTSNALSFTLGSSLIVTAGTSGTLEVRGDLQSLANTNYTAGTVTVALTAGSSNGQGQASSATMSVPTATVAANGLTVATGALSVAQNTGYSGAQTVNPNTNNVKLGSYVMQNTSSSEGVRVTNLAVAVLGTQSLTYLSNLRTSETSGSGSTPINPTAANNFSVNFTLAAGQSKTIDVFADLGSGITASTTYTTLLPTAIGASSNVSMSLTAVTGQTLTVQSGSVSNAPTLNPAPSSLAAQFVVGGASNLGVANYNFVATNGVGTISELKFLIGGGTTAATSTPVTQVCVAGACASVVNNVAYLTGLALSIPNSPSGLNVPVTVTFSTVGVNGNLSNTTAILNLTYMKYTIGGVTTSTPVGTAQVIGTWSSGTTPAAGATTAIVITASSTNPMKVGMVISAIGATSSPATLVGGLGTIATVTDATNATVTWASTTVGTPAGTISFTAVPSNTLTMVGTKPTVSITGSTDQLNAGLVKLAEVTVTADAAGDLKLVNLPISVTTGGTATSTVAAQGLVVTDTSDSAITTTSLAWTIGAGSTGTSTITFGSGYSIPAGTSKTFRIKTTGTGLTTGASNTASLSFSLGASSLMTWNDMLGGVNSITGSQIYGYPSTTSVIHN